MTFAIDKTYPLLAYEQRTWLATGEAAHWESGFWKPNPAGMIEVSNAQDSGRVEVLQGTSRDTDEGLEIVLNSVLHGHDARLIRTRRTFWVTEDRLTYRVEMETHTTDAPALLPHLQAILVRDQGDS